MKSPGSETSKMEELHACVWRISSVVVLCAQLSDDTV